MVSIPAQKDNEPAIVEVREKVTNKLIVQQIHTVTIKDTDFMEKAQKLHAVITERKFVEFCEEKISGLSDSSSLGVWEFLKLLFESDPRAALLNKLGFDPENMSTEVAAFLEKLEKDKTGN